MKSVVVLAFAALVALQIGCSSSPKKEGNAFPKASQLEGKKVALIAIDSATETQKRIVEVSLINQLKNRGTFSILNKKEVDKVRVRPDVDPTAWKDIAKIAGADFALRVKVLEFKADTQDGYSKEKIYDEVLATEVGEENATRERLFKVKRRTVDVDFELTFVNLESNEDLSGRAQHRESEEADNRKGAITLSPVLRSLESASGKAFAKFFDQVEGKSK